MAANVLNSPCAVEMSIYVIRAFIKMRAALAGQADLARRLTEIEKTLIGHDSALCELYHKIKPLLLPPEPQPKRQIGFHVKDALTPSEQALADELAADGLAIQNKFRPEPLHKQTGKGHFRGETVDEICRAKAIRKKKK